MSVKGKEIINIDKGNAVCPVCGSDMKANGVLCSCYPECRYDASLDYGEYPTLQPVKAGVDTVSALKAEHDIKEKEIKKAEEDRIKKESEYNEAIKRREELEKENDQLNNRIKNIENEKKELQVELENKDKDCKILNSKLSLYDMRITKLKSDIGKIQELENEKAELVSAKSSLEQKLKERDNSISKLKAETKGERKETIIITSYPVSAFICVMILLVVLIFNYSGALEIDLNNYMFGRTGLSYVLAIQLYMLFCAASAALLYNTKVDNNLAYIMCAFMYIVLFFSYLQFCLLLGEIVDDSIVVLLFAGLLLTIIKCSHLGEQDMEMDSFCYFILYIIVCFAWVINTDIKRYGGSSYFQVILEYSWYKILVLVSIAILELCRTAYKRIKICGNKDNLNRVNVRVAVIVLHIILMFSAYFYTTDNHMDIAYTFTYNPMIVLVEVLVMPIAYLLMASVAGELAIFDGLMVAAFYARNFWPEYNIEFTTMLLCVLAVGITVLIPFIPFEDKKIINGKQSNKSNMLFVMAVLSMVMGYMLCCNDLRDIEDVQKTSGRIAVCFFAVGSIIYSWILSQGNGIYGRESKAIYNIKRKI
nr:hypothetical protein [Lachnospiraceae bacterium]